MTGWDGDSVSAQDASKSSPAPVVVDVGGLQTLDVRPSLLNYTMQVWSRRHFIAADAQAKAFEDTRDLKLGRLWLILRPFLYALMYGLLFGVLLKTSRGIENFPGFVLIGITYFQFINRLMLGGNGIVKFSKTMIASFKFPRASLVFSRSLKMLYDSIPPAIVSLVIALLLQWRQPLHWTLLFVPVSFLLTHIFGTGLMFIVTRISAFFEDTREITSFISMIWLFSSGVMFSLERYADNPTLYAVMSNNPGYIFLTATRDAIMYGRLPELGDFLLMIMWAFGTFAVGYVFFWQAEDRYVGIE